MAPFELRLGKRPDFHASIYLIEDKNVHFSLEDKAFKSHQMPPSCSWLYECRPVRAVQKWTVLAPIDRYG